MCYLASIGVSDRYEQQEKWGVTARHQCINHVILYLYQRTKGDPVTHMCYATWWSKKEHRTCTSQELRSPCQRCQLQLIPVIREYCEWEHYWQWDRQWKKAETEHDQGLQGSIKCAVTQVLTLYYTPLQHCTELLYSGSYTNMGNELPSYTDVQVCFFINYHTQNQCCLGTSHWLKNKNMSG